MTDINDQDALWQIAVDWVMREHDVRLDAAAQEALTLWLQANPAHRAAYEKASQVWLLTGLIPPSVNDENTSSSHPFQEG